MSTLSVADLRAGYGPVNVLHDVALTVEPGEIVVILGANGAGKTTTMRAISGTIQRSGTVLFDGADISRHPAERIVRLGIAQVPQGRGTFPELSVEENLRIGAYTRSDREVDLDIDLWYETFPRLAERRRQRAGSLSGGEQQMLAIARALMSRPRLLLCDEPSLGLAPLITKELFGIIANLNQRWGIAVLLVEQNANLAMDIAQRVYLLETGRIVASGDAASIAADDSIRKAYLGYEMERFLDALFLGLSSGAIYALFALGLVVVYRGTGHLNFAQGQMATFSAYIALLVSTWTLPVVHWAIPLWLATIVAMMFGFALSGATEITVVRPLSRRSPHAVFVALIAIFLGLDALMNGIWSDPPQETIGSIFPNQPDDFVRIGGAVWRIRDIGNLVLTLIISALLFVLFLRTKVGLAMRAVASNGESGRLVGIPTGRILAGSWGLAGVLAALAGVLYASSVGTITPTLMFYVFVYASAAATLGGLDSPLGAVVAGLGIGIIENLAAEFAPGWIGQEMKLSVAILAILAVLLVRPTGLFGTTRMERV